MKNKKTAIVIGATGLIGKELVKLLINDSDFDCIKVFVRRSMGIANTKIEEHIIDFNELTSIKENIVGDVLFSTLGTTIKQAGSKDAQYLVDYTYQYGIAKIAAYNGVKDYYLVSSSGANAKSSIFYTRMKGELDNAVCQLPFKRIRIFRPSLLLGERDEKRFGESIGSKLIKIIEFIPYLKKYRGIDGHVVGLAMINSSKERDDNSPVFYELDSIFELI